MRQLIEKYKLMADEMKAAIWYTVSNIGQKISPWLVMVILTHMLSTQEYGIYSVFLSWLEIFEIIVTLRIYSSGYVAGLVKNENDRYIYTATMQTLSYLLIGLWLIVYLIFHRTINNFTNLDTKITVVMLVSFMGTVSFGLWSSRQRVNNRYKRMLVATFLYGFLGPVLGAFTVFLKLENSIFWVIAVRVLVQLAVAIPFFIDNYSRAKERWSRLLAIDTLKYNIPLLPYYLSMVLLNHSDRLMIQRIWGYTEAALYSVAYSAAMIVFVVSGAFNLSLQTWLFKLLKQKEIPNKTRSITGSTIVIAGFCILEIIIAPEIILILGGTLYLEAIWVMPPIVLSIIVMFIYQQYVNVLFYYKKTKLILACSVLAAVCNIALNAFFIPIYGYAAAGYTTFVSYLLVLIIYYFMMAAICKKNNIDYNKIFNVKGQLIILLTAMVIAAVMVFLYKFGMVRYGIFVLMGILCLLKRKDIIKILSLRGNE